MPRTTVATGLPVLPEFSIAREPLRTDSGQRLSPANEIASLGTPHIPLLVAPSHDPTLVSYSGIELPRRKPGAAHMYYIGSQLVKQRNYSASQRGCGGLGHSKALW